MGQSPKSVRIWFAIVILAFGGVFSALRPALAIPTETTVDAPRVAEKLAEEAIRNAKSTKEYFFNMAIITALDTAAQRLAQRAAVWVASGGKGQGPLVHSKPIGEFVRDVALDAATDFLNEFSTRTFGLGLCAPIDASISLKIKLGIARQLQPPTPSCSWQQFKAAREAEKRSFESGEFLTKLSVQFDPGENALDTAFTAHIAVLSENSNRAVNAWIERIVGRGFKDLVNPISGNIKTPANLIEESTKTTIEYSGKGDELRAHALLEINNKDLLTGVAANAGTMFLNTLFSKLIERWTKDGILTAAEVVCKIPRVGQQFDLCKNRGGAGGLAGAGGIALASAYYSQIFTPTVRTIETRNPVSELASCPTESRSVENCAIDPAFATGLQIQASGSHLTVREAIEQGVLHGDWPLIPPTDLGKNQDQFCYTYAYCHANLVKLRRARIISTGWEFAAASVANSVANPVRLQEVVSRFNDCNDQGKLDDQHPFCHLIDPDWVLTSPPSQCRALVRGQTLVATGSAERAEVCVDEPSCLSQDVDGNCTGGYGYCTRERNIWHLPGDACPKQFASCDSFTNPQDKELSVLTNTVESGACSSRTVGCRSYARDRQGGAWSIGSRIYLNRSASECPANAAGCTLLEEVKTSATRNRVSNPSFELASGSGADGWLVDGAYTADGSRSFDRVAAATASQNVIQTDIPVEGGQLFTLSFFAQKVSGGAQARVELKQFDAQGEPLSLTPPPANPVCGSSSANAGTCAIVDGFDGGRGIPNYLVRYNYPPIATYERFWVTFPVHPDAVTVDVNFIGNVSGTTANIDAIQLERGPAPTQFHEGGSDQTGAAVRLKVPPDVSPQYLNCRGEEGDPAGCAQYAPVCRSTEVGCDGYTPAGGGAVIPAVVASGDRCDAACAGYSTFKQERSQWETASTDRTRIPIHFIPSTAAQCTAEDVGCEEFTNLERAAAGGEAREYYTFLRACEKPDATLDRTYFTWEGSDSTGYQLKSFVLRKTPGGAPTAPAAPLYQAGTDASKCSAAIFALPKDDPAWNPDCRELYDADGNIYHALLSRTIVSSDNCKQFRKTNPTTTPTGETPAPADLQNDCTSTGGSWNGTANTCTYQGYLPESRTCRAQMNGCRLYTGNNGGNLRIVDSTSFRDGTTGGWAGGVASTESVVVGDYSLRVSGGATVSKEMAEGVIVAPRLVQGRAYYLSFWGKGQGRLTVAFGGPNTPTDASSSFSVNDADPGTPTAQLTSEWQRYSFGPVIVSWTPSIFDTLYFSGFSVESYLDTIELRETTDQFTLVRGSWKTPAQCDQTTDGIPFPQAQLGCTEYTNRANQTAYLKSFNSLCREKAIGCEAYVDRRGTDTSFESVYNAVCQAGSVLVNAADCQINNRTVCTIPNGQSRCRFDWVGVLPAGADLRSSVAPFAVSRGSVYGATDPSEPSSVLFPDAYHVPADTVRYLVNDLKFQCQPDQVGCTALGIMDLAKVGKCTLRTGSCTTDGGCVCPDVRARGRTCVVARGQSECTFVVDASNAAANENVYRKVIPASFKTQLCLHEAVGCEQWTTGSGKVNYFKDPGDGVCEFRDRESVGGIAVSGWFKKGTSEACDPRFAVGGNFFDIRKNADQEFVGFAGLCRAEFATCTEFRDPVDTPPQYPEGRPYFYLNNDKIKTAQAECSGVSQKEGCVALNDLSSPRLTFSAEATYAKSNASGFKQVAPIDCTKSPYGPDEGTYCTAGVSENTNSANIVIRVNRDRQCAEWLECVSTQVSVDPATGRETQKCLSLGLCHEKGPDGSCIRWGPVDGNPTDHNRVLSDKVYAERNVNFGGNDYAGYSIGGRYPIDLLRQVNVKSSGTPEYRLAYTNSTFCSGDGTECGPENNLGERGVCVNFQCVYGLDGKSNLSAGVGMQCKAYPERDAPFPKTVLENPDGDPRAARKQAFSQAKVCELSIGGKDCECSYRKVNYGGQQVVAYYPLSAELGYKFDGKEGEIQAAICNGGPFHGQRCNPLDIGNRSAISLTCVNGNERGQCITVERADSVLGQTGYCLEEDRSLRINGSDRNACLTWLPIDQASGKDLTNQHLTAAFVPKPGQERFCTAYAGYCYNNQCANKAFRDYQNTVFDFCTEFSKYGYLSSGSVQDQVCNAGPNVDAGCTVNEQCPSSSCVTRTFNGLSGLQRFCPRSGGGTDVSYCNNIRNNDCYTIGDHCFAGGRYTNVCNRNVNCTGGGVCNGSTCVGGSNPGAACNPNAQCVFSGGTCQSNRSTCESFSRDFCTDNSNIGCQGAVRCAFDSECGAGNVCKPIIELASRDIERGKVETQKVKIYKEGLHAIGWSADDNQQPLGVNAVMRFTVEEGSARGGWGDWTNKVQDVVSKTLIGPYPSDLLGAYIVVDQGDPGTVTYKLAYPRLVLKDQLKEIRMHLVSNDSRLLTGCDFDLKLFVIVTIINPVVGLIGKFFGWFDDCRKGLDYRTGAPTDGMDLTNDLLLLNEKNGWSGILSGEGGNSQVAIAALFTDTEPRSLHGIRVEGTDHATRGMFLIAGANFHLIDQKEGTGSTNPPKLPDPLKYPSCGVAAYIGSSNPAAEEYVPIPYTNRINTVANFEDGKTGRTVGTTFAPTDANGFPIRWETSCHPWGAFSYPLPATLVLAGQDKNTDPNSPTACKVARGPIHTAYNGKNSVTQLFVTGYRNAEFIEDEDPADTSKGFAYSVPKYNASSSIAYDERESGSIFGIPPQIKSVGTCEGTKCSEGLFDRFSVNGQDGGSVFGRGSLRATLQFFAYADFNHMPIRSVKIDFDSTVVNGIDVNPGDFNYYKNRRGYQPNGSPICSRDAKNAANFGLTPNACDDSGPFTYTHLYTFNPTDSVNCTPAAQNYPAIGVSSGQIVCIYKPRVQLLDNWGWCNSDQNFVAGAKGDNCDSDLTAPWLNFPGQIIIGP